MKPTGIHALTDEPIEAATREYLRRHPDAIIDRDQCRFYPATSTIVLADATRVKAVYQRYRGRLVRLTAPAGWFR